MALPLIWLGAGVAALAAGNQLSKHYDRRKGIVGSFPGEKKHSVRPIDGAIVCCGIYQFFEHTGVWVDDNVIELQGTGLVRGISPARFLHDRSGDTVYVACDENHTPLTEDTIVERAVSQLYRYDEYHVLENNCHKFVVECLQGNTANITSFTDLNTALASHFSTAIHWLPSKVA